MPFHNAGILKFLSESYYVDNSVLCLFSRRRARYSSYRKELITSLHSRRQAAVYLISSSLIHNYRRRTKRNLHVAKHIGITYLHIVGHITRKFLLLRVREKKNDCAFLFVFWLDRWNSFGNARIRNYCHHTNSYKCVAGLLGIRNHREDCDLPSKRHCCGLPVCAVPDDAPRAIAHVCMYVCTSVRVIK